MAKRKPGKGRLDEQTTALYVRLPVEEAEKLNRVSFETKRPKRDVIRMLVSEHLPELGIPAEIPFPPPPLPPPFTVPVPPPGQGPGSSPAPMVYVPAPEQPEVLTAEEAADLLGTDAETIAAMAERGELPGRKVGDEWRFLRRAVLDWLGGAS